MSTALVLFLTPAVLFASSPGAGNFLAMRNGARYGTRAAILGFFGRFCSFLILFAAVAIGLGSIIAASETALTIIKWCGVTYLVWLGVQTLWASRSFPSDAPSVVPEAGTARRTVAPVWLVARQEFLTSITNPKAMLLVSAFLPQFVTSSDDATMQITVLGFSYIALEFVAACMWAALGNAMANERLSGRLRRNFSRLTGGMMLGTAAWLATFSARGHVAST